MRSWPLLPKHCFHYLIYHAAPHSILQSVNSLPKPCLLYHKQKSSAKVQIWEPNFLPCSFLFYLCFHLHSFALGLKERGFYLIFCVVVTTVFREGWLQTIISIIGQTNLSQAFNSTHFILSIHLFLSPRPLHFLPVTCVLHVAPIELILPFVLNHLFLSPFVEGGIL